MISTVIKVSSILNQSGFLLEETYFGVLRENKDVVLFLQFQKGGGYMLKMYLLSKGALELLSSMPIGDKLELRKVLDDFFDYTQEGLH